MYVHFTLPFLFVIDDLGHDIPSFYTYITVLFDSLNDKKKFSLSDGIQNVYISSKGGYE